MTTARTAPSTTFRQRALDEIKRVVWDPAWGEERISNMIATRPDWCISRQRIWGVPIAVFLCDKCHEPLNDAAINKSIVELFKKEGADAWYIHDAAALLPAGTACRNCGTHTSSARRWTSSTSGSSPAQAGTPSSTLEPELHFPADLYTEGGDQHRGWFHSSLLTSVALRDHAPYKMVATSGWTLDEQGRAFSKSLGNGVDPVDVAKRLGGEIIRLWVASVDFREDVAASENLMQRVSDNYRKLRNTLRFLLGNLHDFDPATDAVAVRRAGAARPVHPRPHRRARRQDPQGLRRLRVPPRLPRAQRVREHRPQRALPRRPQRPPLHLRAQPPRAAAARRPPSGASPKPSPASSPPSSASPPTRSGSSCPTSKAAKPASTSPSSPTCRDRPRQHVANSRKTGSSSSPCATKSSKCSKRLAPPRPSAKPSKPQSSSAGSTTARRAARPRLREVRIDPARTLQRLPGRNLERNRHRRQVSKGAFDVQAKPAAGSKCERCWRFTTDVGDEANYPTVCLRCADALEAIDFPPYDAPPSTTTEQQA